MKVMKSASVEGTEKGLTNRRPSYALAKRSLAIGLLFFTATNLFYGWNRGEFYTYGAPPVYVFTSLALILAGSLGLIISALSYLSVQRKVAPKIDPKTNQIQWGLGHIVGDALFGNFRMFIVAAITYAVFFGFLDGIFIYQPNVDFYQHYGITGISASAAVCCGPVGYVPVGLLFIPSIHAGLLLIPLSVLIMILVSALVGLNVSLLYRAARQTRVGGNLGQKKGSISGILGAGFGLFAGCPTCAAAFFLSMIAGSGATAASYLIAQYQPLIVALTIPLLLGSIFWQAKSIRMFLLGCSV